MQLSILAIGFLAAAANAATVIAPNTMYLLSWNVPNNCGDKPGSHVEVGIPGGDSSSCVNVNTLKRWQVLGGLAVGCKAYWYPELNCPGHGHQREVKYDSCYNSDAKVGSVFVGCGLALKFS